MIVPQRDALAKVLRSYVGEEEYFAEFHAAESFRKLLIDLRWVAFAEQLDFEPAVEKSKQPFQDDLFQHTGHWLP